MPVKLPTTFEETVSFLLEHGALEEGHFQLASGRHSGHYVMKGRLVQHAALVHEMLLQRKDALAALGPIDVVLSPAVGGIPVGQQLALVLGCRHVYSERVDNEMVLKRGFQIEKGERIIMAEDVITTGGTLKELKEFVLGQGAELAGVFTLVNRSGKDTWETWPLVSCLDAVFPTYAPDEVPEELAKLPLVRPGTKKV